MTVGAAGPVEDAERESFLKQARAQLAEGTGEATLGDAVVTAIQKQLVTSGFETNVE